ncbi:anaerobic ribonucleoside-triphosphate reductase activating protein [Herbivorax sp. ANBcel31]|uniref:anaerobic ribonucleoside-triphosphate reductase activating protein n=1 Tax=Herbivorax sp. ANBcel31 TaxID=3069754 RepID=UPI0027AE9752|nr:anaerobic ribonucleoside-triphosphate reductase activating protein [Herbivorax sp. ANBcel31]MDQ2086609.1 anaerobic ribonucleoside-triphosphate reductase activating protein [Herbivorax sp. ANBcel31]
MKIAGLQKNSFVDYPGNLCAVVFTQGCNMNCFYCHNKPLIDNEKRNENISSEDVLEFLKKRRSFLDAVVISGGEPTMQKDLENFIKEVKKLKFKVKLDTNGTNPEVIESLISKRLIDYVAMDIKAPFKRYQEFCGAKTDINRIKKSIDILMQDIIDYEFRTTFAPGLGFGDVLNMCNEIKGAKSYILQKCRGFEEMSNFILFTDSIKSMNKMIKKVGTRGVENSA